MRDTLLTGVGALGGGVGGMATGAVVGGVFGDGLTGARVGGGVGLLVGVLSAVLVRGQEVMLPQGTTVEIEIRQPLELDMNRVPVGSPQNYVPPQRPAPPAERAYHRRPPALPFPRLPF